MAYFEDSFAGLFSLSGKVALITGGSRGLGFYTAEAFLRSGAQTVVITARKEEGAQGLHEAVDKLNKIVGVSGSAVGIAADVSKLSEIERLVREVNKLESKLGILVANAAATWGGPFEQTPDSSSIKVLDLNVRSIFNLVKLFVPSLEAAGTEQDPSRVVVVGSVAGVAVPATGEHSTIMYSASKAAAHHLARNLAVELGPKNIATNIVAPGYFLSKLANGIIELLGAQDLIDRNPRKRLGEPADIAGVMIYLCSPAGAYANGTTITLDGGFHFRSPTPNL
ncbi:hypothetical protein V502_02877 [Pseudogymnoascus sp. VKM F-4520 (FW-2644)]|nr:hypothetical protein V502_02877 [Pseudogymnoascus sp. VKM F-4520 (FW-2644)]